MREGTEGRAKRRPRGHKVEAVILLILLADVGIAVFAWHLYQSRKSSVDSSGLDLSKAPEISQPLRLPPESLPPEPRSSMQYLIPDRRPVRGPAPSGQEPSQAGAGRGGGASGPQDAVVTKALRVYYGLKKSPRFRGSRAIAEWQKEFLSYPDLKAINDEYQKDRDPLRFLAHMARSPNFQGMALKYLSHPDLRQFLAAMAGSEEVGGAAGVFLKEPAILSSVKGLGLLGGAGAGGPDGAAKPE